MINIVEAPPIKLSGITSLQISFDFNPDIIPILKSCDKYIYDKKTHIWEFPISCLSYLLDNLTYLDDITLKLYQQEVLDAPLTATLSHEYPPFEHQLEAINYGLSHSAWLLLDEPGMGKSAAAIYLAEELKAQCGLEHCLIICGINTLKTNWKREIEKYSTLSCRILGEKISKKGKISYSSIKERAAELMNPIDAFFIVTNIETLRSADVIQALKTTKNKIGMIVLDEAHKCLVGGTLIETDQGNKTIQEIVDNKLECKIKSFNTLNNTIEYKDIDSYYRSDEKEDLIELVIIDEESIEHKLVCTQDHPIFTSNRGYVEATHLLDTDIILID